MSEVNMNICRNCSKVVAAIFIDENYETKRVERFGKCKKIVSCNKVEHLSSVKSSKQAHKSAFIIANPNEEDELAIYVELDKFGCNMFEPKIV